MKIMLIKEINELLKCKVSFDDEAIEIFNVNEDLEEKLKLLKLLVK